MNGGSTRVIAAEAICRRWRELSIPFIVMHGLEGYPDRLGRDLDILMLPRDALGALSEAAVILRDLGWNTTVCPPPLWGRRLVALREGEGGALDYLEFHTMKSLRWATLSLVDANEPMTGTVGPFPVSAWATFAKATLTPLLAGDLARFDTDYLRSLRQSGVVEDLVVSRTARSFGRGLAEEVVGAVVDLDAEALKPFSSRLRRAALIRMLRHPAASVRALPSLLRQKPGRLVSRSGMRVEIRISGKRDVDPILSQVVDQLGEVFLRVTVSRSRSLLERVRQQYRTLSRQGVVLQLNDVFANAGESASVSATEFRAFGSSRTSELSVPITPGKEDVAAREMVRWIIEQWSFRFQCRGPSERTGLAYHARRGYL